MNRPASGSLSNDGCHEATPSALNPILLGVDMPMMKQIIPLTPAIAPISMFTEVEKIAPLTMSTIPEIRKFSLTFLIKSTHCFA